MKSAVLSFLLPGLALALFVLGVALLLEWIRPFRDMSIEGPIALACWSAGILLAGAALWLRLGWPALNIAALALNALSLAATVVLVILISRSWRMF